MGIRRRNGRGKERFIGQAEDHPRLLGARRAVTVGIAFVGSGYVADLYLNTLANWRHVLELRGVHDRDAERQADVARHYGVRAYPSFDAVLEDEGVEIVVNLTNPDQHYRDIASRPRGRPPRVFRKAARAGPGRGAGIARARGAKRAACCLRPVERSRRGGADNVAGSARARPRAAPARLCGVGRRAGAPDRLPELAYADRRLLAGGGRVPDRLHARTCGLRADLARGDVRCRSGASSPPRTA